MGPVGRSTMWLLSSGSNHDGGIFVEEKTETYLFDGGAFLSMENEIDLFVIPEKRGKGLFNETNIAHFFGNLRKPLRVIGIKSISSNQVAVSYEDQKSDGTDCRATANVFTTYAYGRTLIERISAKC